MTPSLNRCSICGSTHFVDVCWWKGARIVRCSSCGVVFSSLRPDESELLRLYNDGTLPQGSNEDQVAAEITFPRWKLREHSHVLQMLASLGVTGGELLDIGCLWGSFLDSARRSGFQVTGIEPNAPAATYGRKILKMNIFQGSLNDLSLPPCSFDAVTMLDVIEQLRDPVSALQIVRRLLKPEGVLVVVTPNVEGLPVRVIGLKRRIFCQPWCPIDDPPWHLWGFSRRTASRALVRAGYCVEAVEGLSPSIFTTNAGADIKPWKRLGLTGLSGVGLLIGRSDRIAVYGRAASHAG